MKQLRWAVVALVVFALCSGQLAAATITVSSVTGSWMNPNPAGVTISNGADVSTVSWGIPIRAGGSQSSYVFDSDVPPPLSVEVPPTVTPWLDLGNFTHNNFPIRPPSLNSIELSLVLSMMVDGTPISQSFLYTLTHNETNNVRPCAYPGTTICPDQVSISAPSGGTFVAGGVRYTLELRFSRDGGATVLDQFITEENRANTADLFGRFTSELVPIPEPTSMGLIGLGLAGLLLVKRKLTA
ncbi:MAG: THxN family PEP-CTERM protein [Bryobacterales bacterium]|nr:THxN family PEP-CTERM protein [Bryobacterales bacterium]